MGSYRTLFKEVQHLSKTIVYIVTVILLMVLGYIYQLTYEMYLNETSIRGWSRSFKVMLGADVLLFILIAGLLYIVWSYKLVTKVSVRSLYFKMPPIKNSYKKIYKHRILSFKKSSSKGLPRGTVRIKLGGDEGVFLELEDDKKAFIGSRHADKLEKALKRMMGQEP